MHEIEYGWRPTAGLYDEVNGHIGGSVPECLEQVVHMIADDVPAHFAGKVLFKPASARGRIRGEACALASRHAIALRRCSPKQFQFFCLLND